MADPPPPANVPLDAGAALSLACVALGAVAWFIAALLTVGPYVAGDLADIVIGNHLERRPLVVTWFATLVSALVLDVAALWLGGQSRRRVRRSAGYLRGRRVAWVGMASGVVLLALLVALVLLAISAAHDEYTTLVRCAETGACINP